MVGPTRMVFYLQQGEASILLFKHAITYVYLNWWKSILTLNKILF
jgi:sRNA-binding regulator protein Hfq